MSQIIKPIMLDETGQTSVQRLTEMEGRLQQIAEALESVHSVNGMTGDVVIDASNINTNKLNPNSKTILTILTEEQTLVSSVLAEIQAAIARTPVAFSTSAIQGDEYMLNITVSAP